MFCLGGYNILDLIHAYKISQIAQRQHDQVSAFKETSPGKGGGWRHVSERSTLSRWVKTA